VLTSRAEHMMFDARLDGFAFIAKADLCAEQILGAVEEQ
jgi:hypothetical protein